MATFFDQNHESNHKNSMVGQSIIIEVEVGDKVQVTLQSKIELGRLQYQIIWNMFGFQIIFFFF